MLETGSWSLNKTIRHAANPAVDRALLVLCAGLRLVPGL
jgi:hypothetical protein